MKRAIIYTRFNSDLQNATSREDQERMARDYCRREGWNVVDVFSDAEMTGRNVRRPGFQAMREAVRADRADVVVVEDMDRLSRSVVDVLSHYELMEFQGMELHALKEGRQDFFKVLLNSLGAQMFSESIAKPTRRGMQGALTRGRLHTSAYGYRKIDTEHASTT